MFNFYSLFLKKKYCGLNKMHLSVSSFFFIGTYFEEVHWPAQTICSPRTWKNDGERPRCFENDRNRLHLDVAHFILCLISIWYLSCIEITQVISIKRIFESPYPEKWAAVLADDRSEIWRCTHHWPKKKSQQRGVKRASLSRSKQIRFSTLYSTFDGQTLFFSMI